jgi:hypothetical protein
MRALAFYSAALVLVMLVPRAAAAQTLQRGAIHGTVRDQAHAVLGRARITLINDAVGYRRDITAQASGDYYFEAVPAGGGYSIIAEAAGFAATTVKGITVGIGSALTIIIEMRRTTATEVPADSIATVDMPASGLTQQLNPASVQNLPVLGRDFRDLALLAPTAQWATGRRGGLRIGGQESDFSGLAVDGMNTRNNFLGDDFGSLEDRNFILPLDSVQEFQVVANGVGPEFGSVTGGLINVATKSGTNDWHGEAHEYYRGGGLTAHDALGTAPNIDSQNQFGGSVGFPIRAERQFLFLSVDVQRESGPLTTEFCAPGNAGVECESELAAVGLGPIIQPPCLPGIGNCGPGGASEVLPANCAGDVGQPVLSACYGLTTSLHDFEGAHNESQNFFTVLGHYDYQVSSANRFSARVFGTRNRTNGSSGGAARTETIDAFGNRENFVNQGVSGFFSLNTALGLNVNEVHVGISGEKLNRNPIQAGAPEIQILGIGNFGQRFDLPSNIGNGKLQAQDNYAYNKINKHRMKIGGGVDASVDRNYRSALWSAGEYMFNSLCDFDPNPVTCAGVPNAPSGPDPSAFYQAFGLNGSGVFAANALKPDYQIGLAAYAQDQWQVTPRVTLTYGLRWDGTHNPQVQHPIWGNVALAGDDLEVHQVPMPQKVPNDWVQVGPRVGIAWNAIGGEHPTVLRVAYGVFFAETPTIFFAPVILGSSTAATLYCSPSSFPANAPCTPPQNTNIGTAQSLGGFPYLDPSSLPFGVGGLCGSIEGCPSPAYADPDLRNPKVQNLTFSAEQTLARNWTLSVSYAFEHSDFLRIGGYGTTIWNRNFATNGTDAFGRAILTGPLDPTQASNNELASFGRANFHTVVFAVNKRFSKRYQLFGNYSWSRNYSDASGERDTDSYFGPQDPLNTNLDYGRSELDTVHQFKGGGVVTLPLGITWSSDFVAHSGLAYPAYVSADINGDGVTYPGLGTNDRPAVQIGNSAPFLLPEYPGRQPWFFNWNMRVAKEFHLGERYRVGLSADLFNVTNASNLYSEPGHSAFVDLPGCTTNAPPALGMICPPLNSLPAPGEIASQFGGTKYRTLDELTPGATPFAAQFGVRFEF